MIDPVELAAALTADLSKRKLTEMTEAQRSEMRRALLVMDVDLQKAFRDAKRKSDNVRRLLNVLNQMERQQRARTPPEVMRGGVQ